MSLIAALVESGRLRTVDLALADALRKLDPATPDTVLAAAALASFAVAQGHAGLSLSQPERLFDGEVPIAWPDPAHWRAALDASAWVSKPAPSATADPARPLALETPPGTCGLLYLRRYREYEQRLAARLEAIAAGEAGLPTAADAVPAALAPLFARLFPHGDDDRQADAARLVLSRQLALITGGPGTGKTATIARMLWLLIAQARHAAQPVPRIALAAPTGRAAERMAESLRSAVQTLQAQAGIDAGLGEALPLQARTLHRLLGPVPGTAGFRHRAGHPLAYDIVVVDEASMVDLPLMCKLVEAVAPGARLVLLGDRDQLPSVEAGDVLAAIVDGTVDGALRGHRVHLERGWRQGDGLRIAPLADAVRGSADPAVRVEVLALLREGALQGVHFHQNLVDPLRDPAFETFLGHWRALQAAADPASALREATRARLLVAVREGPQGARILNQRIEARLAGPRHEPYFHGRLLLVTENSYAQGLFNGDIGVCLADADGQPVAWFAGADPDRPRPFHPAALPAHESAFAMTVHKAQGSEFDRVWLMLPARDSRVLSRELVYTGITRARHQLHVAATAPVLEAALARHASRVSGLAWRLGAG